MQKSRVLIVVISVLILQGVLFVTHANNSKNIKSINRIYIEVMARKIFADETGHEDFVGIHCSPDNVKSSLWVCNISQIAESFDGKTYQVLPPGSGDWLLYLNYKINTFRLIKTHQTQP
ncbi:hypothetical protein GCM10011365_19470 [Marinicella pacifica]|uniref:Uncharacterized protein n=1 Tax=Marinicella pacifica TaxID=1171543 RepID=A0A917CU45_9GAMM|nr:hypothetical protein [Marinicella pacifica]GGF98281.1 hypothetical protein GCM10011365_19470 [Marinicella pacifica]